VHPVVWMGTLVRALERRLPSGGPKRQLFAGTLLAAFVPFACAALGVAVVEGLRPMPAFAWLAQVFLLTAMFAARMLGTAAERVAAELRAGRIDGARAGLQSLCSRDATDLDEPELVGASVESVAENASDSFVAPLFYYALFGLPGAVFYRAVNTLDAMVGYRGHYEYLGKASARLDDVLNFIPARLSTLLLLVAGALLGKSPRRGIAAWRRDAATTASPNAGQPMAAMAGLLGVRLEKRGHYALGDAREPLSPAKIGDAWRIVQLSFALGSLLTLAAAVVRR
jgi:adenosylcobinamide-phosphate synthase